MFRQRIPWLLSDVIRNGMYVSKPHILHLKEMVSLGLLRYNKSRLRVRRPKLFCLSQPGGMEINVYNSRFFKVFYMILREVGRCIVVII